MKAKSQKTTSLKHLRFYRIFKACAITGLILICLVIFTWFYRYRWAQIVSYNHSAQMEPTSIEGYMDKHQYSEEDTATLFIRSANNKGTGVLRRISAPYQYQNMDTFHFGKIEQPLNDYQASNGCDWSPVMELPIKSKLKPGYYNILLTNQTDTSNITFLVNDPDQKADIVVLSPTSTWVAYNKWGGKSLYSNGIDSSDVYFVAANRPNTALNYTKRRRKQSIHVEAQIFNWFDQNYNAALLPDYALERMHPQLKKADIIVLAYHCEYFSEKMYDNLEKLVYKKEKSLLALGGNQIYIKVQWNNNYSQMECHKDLTFFKNQWELGGNWRNNFRSEALFLGGRYTPSGLHTFAPYKVKKPNHWLFDGLNLEKGDLFGKRGINKYPLSGYETDKPTIFSKWNITKVAKGLNPKEGAPNAIFKGEEARNTDNRGGAVMTLKRTRKENGILNTASIQSGAGLGADSVFTGIIQNFVEKFKGQ